MTPILTVSQINLYLKSIIDYDENLNNIYVCGEISNFTNHYRTGHFYFSLKDDNSLIKAVMFRQYAQSVNFEPYNGLKVLIRGKISVYERDGVYQLYAYDMQPDGLGSLNLAFEQLKEKLEKEGLFSPEYKKPIPPMPEKIAVITSPTGAAVQDIKNVISRRYPCCEMIVVPVQVQGENSAKQIVDAINKVNLLNCADVIILARGGGSIEDLWSFNEEAVARAIFQSGIPIISGVGHETDFTICDFVSDLRAPTPSAAAELATPDIATLYNDCEYFSGRLSFLMQEKIFGLEMRLQELSDKLDAASPKAYIEKAKDKLGQIEKTILNLMNTRLRESGQKLVLYSSKLDALSPLKTLMRGYSLVFDENNKHLDSVNKINVKDNLEIQMKDGRIFCTVGEIKNENRYDA